MAKSTTYLVKAFKPIRSMKAYMFLILAEKDGEFVDAKVFFQDLRNTNVSTEQLFTEWTRTLNPRVKNPMKSKLFQFTVAKADERFIESRDKFINKYRELIKAA